MWKLLASGTLLSLVLAPVAGTEDGGGTAPEFASARLYIEFDAVANEAVVAFEAESEDTIAGVELRSPAGEAVFALRTRTRLGSGTSELSIQSAKLDLDTLLATYPEGLYRLRARTAEGETQCGSAVLERALPNTPRILFPVDGTDGVAPSGLTLQWSSDLSVDAWRIVLEQDEKDGLTAYLPKGSASFAVPPGVLAGSTRTRAEVSSIGANGNIVQSEVLFRTQ